MSLCVTWIKKKTSKLKKKQVIKEYILYDMFYKVQNQTICCLGMHIYIYVENYKGKEKINDKVDRSFKNSSKLKTSG